MALAIELCSNRIKYCGLVNKAPFGEDQGLSCVRLYKIDIYMYMKYTVGPTVSGRVLIDFCILLE